MAKRRMLSKEVIDTDKFLDMPLSTQALYLHLLLKADDDGFVANPKRILRMVGAGDDELKVLLSKEYVIPFDSGVCVIKHWRLHNWIRGDRKHDTNCQEEIEQLEEKNGEYYLKDTMSDKCLTNDRQVTYRGKDRLGKVRLGKDRLEREDTPKQIANDFLNNHQSEHRKMFLDKFIEKGYNEEEIKKEINKFILYWTEPNSTGKRQRWETQRTFEVGRRLITWFNNSKNFNNNKSKFTSI